MTGDYLTHHGILGQKWGVRRFQNKDGSYTEEGKRRRRSEDYSADEIRKRELIKKGTKHLSTKEIEEVNRRQNAEDVFNKHNSSVGKQFVGKLGSKMLEKSAEVVATVLVVNIGQAWLKKRLGL